MSYRDLREWLQQVEKLGELKTIEGADWDLEIGAIIEMARKESQVAPCILFDSIKGYEKGWRIVAGQLNSIKRVALTCGMPTDMATMDLVKAMRQKIKDRKPIAPREVKDGALM
jgi:UbiD family decarboxylase